MTASDRQRWDERHRERGPVVDTDVVVPTVFAPYEQEFPTEGRALELGCGRGAAAVWSAERGLDVLAVDVSPVALAAARALAHRRGVEERCRFVEHDLDEGLPAGPPVELLIAHFFRGTGLAAAIQARLAPGGLLAIAVLSEVGGSPGRHRAAAGELLDAYDGVCVLAHDEGDGRAWLLGRRTHDGEDREST